MAGSESEMGDETEFQTAYQEFQAEKQEARRLQGLVATLTTERAEYEADTDEQVMCFRDMHAEAVADADETLSLELRSLAETTERLTKEITEAKASLEAIRKRGAKRTESLFSLLNDDLRQQ